MEKEYNIFISHSWRYSDQYDKIIDMLKKSGIKYKDYSVPLNNPLHTSGTDKELYDAIKRKIAPTSVVLILAGVYSSYSKWIDKEIKICKTEFYAPKKIIAINPWASTRTSTKVKDNADLEVNWNTSSIVKAIKELG